MSTVHEARFSEPLADKKVLCTLCPHDCRIADKGRGACSVRYNRNGRLYTLVYDKVVARGVDPIEKKPFFHFHPGSYAYSISTVGCNLRCSYCQNWQISQWPKDHLPARLDQADEAAPEPICPLLDTLDAAIPGEPITPSEIVCAAERTHCLAICYTYTEPTIFFELAQDTALLAKEAGLKNGFVSNGFIKEAPLRAIAPLLDVVNVDLKFFRDESYRRISRARLGPVLEAIRLYHALGVWVEVTTLLVPGLNDTDEELTQIAEFLCDIDPAIPWHLSRYFPAYRMHDHPPTPIETLRRAAEIGRRTGLRYIYGGNAPGEGDEDTRCHQCGARLIERFGFVVRQNRIRGGACPECGMPVAGVGMDGG